MIFLFLSLFVFSQQRIYFDEKGDTISERYAQNKLRDKELGLVRWDSLGDNKKRYIFLKKSLYQRGSFYYKSIKEELEKITSQKIPDTNSIILEYYYKGDLCSSSRDDKWTAFEINDRKEFLNPIKLQLEQQGITFICLFENGMKLRNRRHRIDEYFYMDRNNYFRDKLFRTQTLCGSFAAIKPNGETLIRNGEYRADYMAIHLDPEKWTLFFKEDE